jgi:hypothetical protein
MDLIPSSSISGPIVITNPPLTYETTGVERLLSIALRRIEELANEIKDIKTKQILEETQLDRSVLDENGLLPPPVRKTKRGRGYRPILQSEIEEAQAKAETAMGAARLLGISYPLFRKYAKRYGIHRINRSAARKPCYHSPEKGKYPLSEILDNKHPNLGDYILKDKLIRYNVLKPKCNLCGFEERRLVDNKMPLLLDHKDGDRENCRLENLQLLCLNCTFTCGRGFIRTGKKLFDPDWFQGSSNTYIEKDARW